MGILKERHIEIVLKRKPSLIEPNLKLVSSQFGLKRKGRIDLLCKDSQGEILIVEIKTIASKESINQLLHYKDLFKELIKPDSNPRLALCCLAAGLDIIDLCKEKGILLKKYTAEELAAARVFRFFELPQEAQDIIYCLMKKNAPTSLKNLSKDFNLHYNQLKRHIYFVDSYVPLIKTLGEDKDILYQWPTDFPFTTSPLVKNQPDHIRKYLGISSTEL
tara:strand:- start:2201 stop:2857 length:657 start_codon:yes stop_codon:yes gene_type:complete